MATKKPETKTEKVEREYIIPLRVQWRKVPRYKRAAKAVKAIKEFLVQHMKIYDRDLKKIKIDQYLNEQVWFRGIRSPPHKIKVKAIKEKDYVRVELVDYPDKLKFKKLRAEKLETKSKEAKEKKKTLKEKMQESVQGKKAPLGVQPQGSREPASRPKNLGGKKTDEEKKVEKEKSKSGEEEMKKLEKAQAKSMKTQAGGKEKKKTQPKRMALAK